MAAFSKSGVFNTGTGIIGSAIPIVGLGFQPSCIIFFWAGKATVAYARQSARRGFGWATGIANRRCISSYSGDALAVTAEKRGYHNAACISEITAAGAHGGLIDLQSLDSDGFTLVVDAVMSADMMVGFLAFGGDIVASEGNFAKAVALGNYTPVSGIAFQPKCVFLITLGTSAAPPNVNADSSLSIGVATAAAEQIVLSTGADDAVGTSVTSSYHNDVEIEASLSGTAGGPSRRTSFVAFTADGFTLNNLEGTTAEQVGYLCLGGVNTNFKCGNFLSRTDLNNFAVAGLGFKPLSLLFFSHNFTETVVDAAAAPFRWSIGAGSSALDSFQQEVYNGNGAVANSFVIAGGGNRIYSNISTTPAVVGLMDLVSRDAGGFTIKHSQADPAQTFITFLAVGPDLTVSGSGTGIRPRNRSGRKRFVGLDER